MKKLVFSTLLVLQAILVFAQQPTGITGKVIDSKTNVPLQNVVTTIENTNLTQLTNAEGKFTITGIGVGNQLLKVKSDGYKEQLLSLEIIANQVLDLGVVVLEEDVQTQEQQLSLVTLTENDLGDDNSGSESTSGLLQASRDAFQQAAAFNWGQARFRIRGLDSEYGTTMINGVVMNKIYDGRPQWSNWGGLNDATRNQEFTLGLAPSDYTFGGVLGTQEINTRASVYRPGTRISFSGTNTNYNWRMMGTHASGLDKKGWAFAISASRRWAQEAYFEGTNYSANSFFASVEKRFGTKHALNFTSIFAQNKRGKSSANSAEVTNMAGIKYNSYWGWQNGEKRNARYKNVEEPILMLSHFWKLSDKTKLNTNISYQLGTVGNSRIDYQGVPNPDPTYYRNLPSYYTSLYENDKDIVNANNPNVYLPGGIGGLYTPDLIGYMDAKFWTQKQLDWTSLYLANSKSVTDTNGNILGYVPWESKYVLYEDRTDDKVLTANSIITSQVSDNLSFNAGATFRKLKSNNYQYLVDLLGGTHFNDIDTFADVDNGQSQESDLNNPGRQVVEGDKFGYNYNLFANTYDGFAQFKFNYDKADFFIASNFSRSEYQREGLYKNGIYQNNSFGKSDKITYDNFGFKGGLTLKIIGSRHMFNMNGAYMTKAPSLRNVFPNARLNNNTIEGLTGETISSADASYIIRTPKLKTRLTGYYSLIKNATETSFFFAEGIFEDEGAGSTDTDAFVAETVTGMDKRNMGAELGIEYQLTSTIKITAAANYGENVYANNPNISVNNDGAASATNMNPVISFGKAYLKNYKLAGSPQQAASFGIEYRDPHFWWIGANANYLRGNYIDIAPLLRTKNFFKDPSSVNGLAFPEATEARARELLKQEKFDDIKLVNLSGGKSWRTKDGVTLGFFASVNNVLDFTYKTGGFESIRNANYRLLNQDVSSGTPSFGPKYFYGYGRTYFVNLYVNF